MSKLLSHYCPLASPTTFTSKQKHQPSTVKELEFIMWGVWQLILHLISNHTVIHIEWLYIIYIYIYIYIYEIARDILGLGNGVSESLLKLEEDAKKEHSVKVNKPHTKSITIIIFKRTMEERIIRETTVANQSSWPSSINRNWLETRQEIQARLWSRWAENKQQAPLLPLAEGGPGELASSMGEGRGVQGLAGGCWLGVLPALLLLWAGGALSTLLLLPLPMLLLALQKWRRGCFLVFFFLVFLRFCPEFDSSEHAVIFS